ncbi:MAG: hypothetical protein JO138_21755 [Acidobacteriaceae bacterium]|nr:hypothetical protein [Acidobacteriaceae bacterium]
MQSQVESLQRALSSAIQSGELESASSIAGKYAASIKAALHAAPNQQRRETIFASANASLEHALRVARVTRSHLALRLAALQRESAYQAQTTKPSRWSMNC